MKSSMMIRVILSVVCGLMEFGVFGVNLSGYASNGYTWVTNQVVYYVNPQSIWVSPSAATSAIQSAAVAWSQQSHANVQLVYGGTTSGSSAALNNKNEVFFRNDSGDIATTYWFIDSSGHIVDADIMFHEAAYQFFTFSGCLNNGIYVEDVAIHEFGHVLGLSHSETGGATMSAFMPGYCDTTQETLHPDDISGIESLYPAAGQVPAKPTKLTVAPSSSTPTSALVLSWLDNAINETGYQVQRSTDGVSFAQIASLGANSQSYTNSGLAAGTTYFYRVIASNSTGTSAYSDVGSAQTQAASTNTAPAISIATPFNNSSYPAGTLISFSGSATDTQDGTITSTLVWTSNVDGQIGTGGAFSKTLSSGTHTITAKATDTGGLSRTAQVTVTVNVAASVPNGPTLTARGYKVKGAQQVDLTWRGFSSSTLDFYRNGARVMTTPNDGAQTDPVNGKGKGSYSYKGCEAGTTTCSNSVTVVF